MSPIVTHSLQRFQHNHTVPPYHTHANALSLTVGLLFDGFVEHDVEEDLVWVSVWSLSSEESEGCLRSSERTERGWRRRDEEAMAYVVAP